MCMYKISSFYCRYGNNILQILNHIKQSETLNFHKIHIKKHPLFTLKNQLNNKNSCSCKKIISGNTQLILESPATLSDLKRIFKQYLQFNKNLNIGKQYDIGFHIRSGDIFKKIGQSHPLYLQPPLYYYTNIINKNKNKNIIIIFEDKKNPVINKLIELYNSFKNIIFQSSNPINDIITLANCKCLVFSNGTFCLVPYVISNTIQKIIAPDYLVNNKWYSLKDKFIEFINLPNYIPFKSWKNTKQQIDIMLKYKL